MAAPHTFWLRIVLSADSGSLGKEFLLFDWFIVAESLGVVSRIFMKVVIYLASLQLDHISNTNAHLRKLGIVREKGFDVCFFIVWYSDGLKHINVFHPVRELVSVRVIISKSLLLVSREI